MARDRNEMVFKPLPAAADMKRPAHQAVGAWNGDTFAFHSPQDERAWHSQAYRQSVHPNRWQAQAPVDQKTQAALDGMPELGGGRFYRGPDGKHRRITMDQREDVDVQAIRRTAFNDYANTGVTWTDLAAYDEDKPHPGEEEAIALTQARSGAKGEANASLAPSHATGPNKTRDMGSQPKDRGNITEIAGDIDLNLDGSAAAWGIQPPELSTPPVLVATTDKAVSGLPKELVGPKAFLPPATTTPGQRRSFNESLIGRPANDNQRLAGTDRNAVGTAQGTPVVSQRQSSEQAAGMPTGAAGEAGRVDVEQQTTDRLFNWSRKGNPAPAPSEYAIHAVSEEGRFTYLEQKKDEWSRLLEQDPETVFFSMTGEVDKLSNAAQQDFYTGFHRPATPAERAEIDEAVTKMVFAPAEHWSKAGGKPNEKAVESKPFLGISQSAEMSGSELSGAFSEAAKIIAEGKIEKFGGRPGNKETRKIVARVVAKLAKAIEACGGKVRTRLYGPDEKFIPKVRGQIKGGSFADGFLDFEYKGKRIGFFGNHASMYADGVTLKTGEANQIHKMVNNIARGIVEGDLEMDAAGIGYFGKRKQGQSMKDYLRSINDFVSKMVNCKRPFLIKIRIEKSKSKYSNQPPRNDHAGR